MASARAAREVLEAVIWRHLPDRTLSAPGAVDAILAAATVYAVAFAADTETAARRRELARELRPPDLKPCGTRAAAVRHRRHGEPLCAACIQAESRYQAAGNRRRAKARVAARAAARAGQELREAA